MKKRLAVFLVMTLLVCLLPAWTTEAHAEEATYFRCLRCKKYTAKLVGYCLNEGYDPKPGHWLRTKCVSESCGYELLVVQFPESAHTGGDQTPTCTTGKICAKCGYEYGQLGHDWGEWTPTGDTKTHTRACKREGCEATETGTCGGDSSATCVTPGTCGTCGGAYYGDHGYDGTWQSDANSHWKLCVYCGEEKANEAGHFFVTNIDSQFLKSEATCVSPAVYYKSCGECLYKSETETFEYGDRDPDNHDYAEETVVKPTCTKDGYTLHTCKNCDYSYKDNVTKKLLHWFGEWSDNGDGTHSAACKRSKCRFVGKAECAAVERTVGEETLVLCPVCGDVSDGAHLAWTKEAKAKGKGLPKGELILRMGETASGESLLSVGFEYAGALTQPKGEVKITLPAELLNGRTLSLLNPDGIETELPFTVSGETAELTLDFTNTEAHVLRLIPTAS